MKDLLKDEPLGQKLIKKSFWLYLFAYLIAPAGYLIRMLISNSISVEEVGVLYSILSLIGLLNVYNDLGLTESLLYFLPRYWIKKQFNYAKTAVVLGLSAQIITAILIATLLWFGAPWLSDHYFHHESAVTILRYFCFYFLGINLFQTLQTIYNAFQDTFSTQFIDFIKIWSVLGFTFFFFITGQASIVNYSVNWIFGLVIGIIVGIIIFNKKYTQVLTNGKIVWHKPMVKKYIRYAFWVFLGTNAGVLFGNISQQLVIIILGAEMAGYYANYLSLFNMSILILGPILALIFPLVSEMIAKKQKLKLGLLQNFFYTYLTLLTIGLVGLFTVLGPELSMILFSKKFLFSGQLLLYSAWFAVFGNLIGFNFGVLAGLGKIKERVKIIAITVGVSIVVNLILLPIIGIRGAIIAMGLGLALMFLLSYRYVHKHEPVKIQWGIILKNIPLIVVLSFIIWHLKGEWFIFDDLERYRNLGVFVVLALGYGLIFTLYNWMHVKILIREIKKLKN